MLLRPRDRYQIVRVKRCNGCEKDLPLTSFYKNKWMRDGFQTRCKECRKKYDNRASPETQKKWRDNNKSKVKSYKLKHRYGITLEQRKALGESCEICSSKEELCVDHCHTTGKVRGILCRQCNLGISNLKETKGHLEKAIEYLERNVNEET